MFFFNHRLHELQRRQQDEKDKAKVYAMAVLAIDAADAEMLWVQAVCEASFVPWGALPQFHSIISQKLREKWFHVETLDQWPNPPRA